MYEVRQAHSEAPKIETLRCGFMICGRHGTIALLLQRELRIQIVEPILEAERPSSQYGYRRG